ncbi:MAG: phytanoyl-CoA dioxygenase family protein [Oligoflexales bacterium]
MELSSQQHRNYTQNGFLILPKFFTEQELVPLKAWISRLVNELATYLLAEGKIKSTYADKPLSTRLIWIEKEYPLASVCIHSLGEFSHELHEFSLQKPMISLIETLLGKSPGLHPVWNLRAKTPQNPLATVPWHQDTAYLQTGSESISQITTWVPLFDVTLEQGPLVFIKGGHSQAKVYPHQLESGSGHPDSWYLKIAEDNLPKGEHIFCPVPAGSLVLFNQLIPHCCLENFSKLIRWTIDLRWQDPSLSNGMGAGKECLPIKSSMEQWDKWGKQKRAGQNLDTYNTTISGPWLDRWKV